MNCSNTFYCKYNTNNNKCKVRNKEQCQSKFGDTCEDTNNCVFDDSHGICHDKKSGPSVGGDCSSYSSNKNICKNALEDCKYDSNMCKTNVENDTAINNDLNTDDFTHITPVSAPAAVPAQAPAIPAQAPAIPAQAPAAAIPEPAAEPAQAPAAAIPEPAQAPEPAQTPANPDDNFTVGGRIKKC